MSGNKISHEQALGQLIAAFQIILVTMAKDLDAAKIVSRHGLAERLRDFANDSEANPPGSLQGQFRLDLRVLRDFADQIANDGPPRPIGWVPLVIQGGKGEE